MPDLTEYRRSISRELISTKDRVRNFIGLQHLGEDGRYKEIILIDILRNALPQNVSVGTGFVIGSNGQTSKQIDILVYRNDTPVLFKKADFVIVPKESVLGIIEVKTTLRTNEFNEIFRIASKNGELIGDTVFNGIFGYETDLKIDALSQSIRNPLTASTGFVNNICFGKDYFSKYWDQFNRPNEQRKYFSFYKLEDLAFGYFISNLVEDIHLQLRNQPISTTLRDFLYPIEGTKEQNKIDGFDVLVN